MKRLLYMLTAVLLCLLSAVGADDLILRPGVNSGLGTLAGISAFVANFFMIEPVRRQWQNPYLDEASYEENVTAWRPHH